jgi:hypothetical protein
MRNTIEYKQGENSVKKSNLNMKHKPQIKNVVSTNKAHIIIILIPVHKPTMSYMYFHTNDPLPDCD